MPNYSATDIFCPICGNFLSYNSIVEVEIYDPDYDETGTEEEHMKDGKELICRMCWTRIDVRTDQIDYHPETETVKKKVKP